MRILAAKGKWLSTADAARILQVNPRTVRSFASTGQLAYSGTRAGQWLFQKADVERLVLQRARVRALRREELMAEARPKMLQASLPPRQARFRLIAAAR